MGIVVTSGGSPRNNILYDVSESWNGIHNAALAGANPQGQLTDIRFSPDFGGGGSATVMFTAINGAIGGLAYSAAVTGRLTHTWTSLAAGTSISTSNSNGSFGVPLGRRFTSPTCPIPPDAFPRPFWRYRFDFLVRGIVGPGAADVTCGIVSNNAAAMITGGVADPFVGWCSRGALNGGRWTPRLRLVAAGAFVDGTDSGVPFIPAPTAFVQLSIVYDEGLIPRVRWLLNGREVFQIAGDANMITPNGIGFPAKAVGLGAGASQSEWCETRFRIEELG